MLYVETHQTGSMEENCGADRSASMCGEGAGAGYNIPMPMPAGAGSAAYLRAFKEVLEPVAEQFKPELVILVAGFASNVFDPLCRQQLTADGYGKLTEIVRGIADRWAQGRLLAVLEGGKGNYMAYCILRVIEAMSGESTSVKDPVQGLLARDEVRPDDAAAIEAVKSVQRAYWKL